MTSSTPEHPGATAAKKKRAARTLAQFGTAVLLATMALGVSGCGSYLARRLAQAPNTYPTWFAPHARVELRFGSSVLTNFPVHYAEVGPPEARIRYRIVEPADYQFKVTTSNWTEHGQPQYQFSIHATAPGKSNAWTANPRGTVLLLHGYGLAQFAMAPWAFQLAEDGWRCVLVDLRGHGKSTGDRIFYGTRETTDMTQLLDVLKRDNLIGDKVGVVGESYGASLALRWKGLDPRVGPVVAIAPYAVLSNAVLNIGSDYAGWVPEWTVKSGLRNLPELLDVDPWQLDTISVLNDRPVPALFIAAGGDKVAPEAEVRRLEQAAAPGSQLIVVPDASHEAVTYFFDVLADPVRDWLSGTTEPVVEKTVTQ